MDNSAEISNMLHSHTTSSSQPSQTDPSTQAQTYIPSKYAKLNFVGEEDDPMYDSASDISSTPAQDLFSFHEESSKSSSHPQTDAAPQPNHPIPTQIEINPEQEDPPGPTQLAPTLTVQLSPTSQLVRQVPTGSTVPEKQESNIRIIAQNCRGVTRTQTPMYEHYVPAIESFKDNKVDAILLSETNTDWTRHDTHYTVATHNRLVFSPSPTKTVTASCKRTMRDSSALQTGGVMTLLAKELPPRIQSTQSDPYGRWTRTQLYTKTSHVTIYNTYHTHSKTLATAGIHTPWMHQWRAITRDRKLDDVDPRAQHITDLIEQVQKDHTNGYLPIIIGDFNEDLDNDETTGIKLLLSTCNLVNAFQALTGMTPSSHQNNRKVFHTFVHPNLLNFINSIGVLDEMTGFSTSDYLPFILDLDKDIFNTKLQLVLPHNYRILRSTNIANVETYVTKVLEHLHQHNIPARLRRLQTTIQHDGFTSTTAQELDIIDALVTKTRLQCEHNLVKPLTPFKITDITKRKVNIIRLLQNIQRRVSNNQEFTSFMTRLEDLEYLQTITPTDLPILLKEEHQYLKQLQNDNALHRDKHLQALAYEARMAAKTETEKAKIDEHKERASVVTQMRNRERQTRAWKKISYAMNQFTPMGVVRLGIPQNYDLDDIQGMWDLLQQPYANPTWRYITDPELIEQILIKW